MDGLAFLEDRIAAFLDALGTGWATGELEVVHEHFASECIRDFLADRWRPLSKSAQGPRIVLATVAGERHCLGLHMVALAVAMADRRVVFLGADTPVEQIAGGVTCCEAEEVALSISECTNPAAAAGFLTRLCDQLSHDVEVIAGGRGAPDSVDGVRVIENLRDIYEHLER